MKTLAQVEARTAIDPTQPGFTTPYTISQPGSYYLTGNLTVSSGDAIRITASGVTLDLNGFTISSTAPSAAGTAILFNAGGLSDITICNGHIRGGVTKNASGVYGGPGFDNGITLSSAPAPTNVSIIKLSVSGCMGDGIRLDFSGVSLVVEACTVKTVIGYGIIASSVKGSTALECGGHAIFGQLVSDCYGYSDNGIGVYTVTAQHCYGYSSSSIGIYAQYAALNCYGGSNSDDGISTITAQNCRGESTYSVGIQANAAENCDGISNTYIGLRCLASNGGGAGVATGCHGVAFSSGAGLVASTAQNSYGSSVSGSGISATTALNCFGESRSGYGISAVEASSCFGRSNSSRGISVQVATSCYGTTVSGGAGLYASEIATGSYGGNSGSGATNYGVQGFIMNSCRGVNASGYSVSGPYKYNMP